MTILIINHHPRDVVGGSEIQCDLIASELTRRGHQVVYLAVNGRRPAYDTAYRVEPAALRWGALRRIIRVHRPDVVYWRFNKRQWLSTALLCALMRVKIVFAIAHINDVRKWSHKARIDAPDWRGKIRQSFQRLRAAASSRLNHFGFAFARGIVAQLESQRGFFPGKSEVVIPNSVDARAIPFVWPRPFVVWAASIKPSKNPEQFLALARQLQDFPIDFLMAGEINSPPYADQIRQAETWPNFHYLGLKSYHELNGIMQAARLLVHTCEPEGFPNVFIQAWMQGTPIVSAYYDPDQLIQRYQLGVYSGTFEQFQHDVRHLLAHAELREDFGQRAKHFAQERFNLETQVKQLEAFFERVRAPV